MANICRLCLNTVPPFSKIPVYKDRPPLEEQIKYLLPEIDMDRTSTFNLCNICGNLLQTAYSFVRTCRETEETIENYITRYNTAPVDLDEVKKFKNEHLPKIPENSSEDFVKIEMHDAEIKTEMVEQITAAFVCNKCHKTFEDEHMVEQHQRRCFLLKCNQCEKALHTIEEYNKHCESHSILTTSVLNVNFHEVEKFQIGNSTMIRDVSEDVVSSGLQTLEAKTEIEEVDEKCYDNLEDETIEKESGHSLLISPKLEDVKVEPLDVEVNTEMDIDVKEQLNVTFVCNECHKFFEGNEILEKLQKEHLLYKCDQCENVLVTKDEYNRYRECHSIVETQTSSICKETFHQGSELDVHNSESPVFSCQMELENDNLIHKTSPEKNHIQFNHETDRPHKCQICGMSFKRKTHLTRHIQCKHEIERPYKCETCDKSFKRKSYLTSHIECKHEIGRPYKCPTCSMSFKQRITLIRHIQCKHEIDRPYKCQICDMSFKRKITLRIHVQSKHVIDRPYKCQTCDMGFKQKSTLVNHIKCRHEIKRTYQCEICDMSFKQEMDLTSHRHSKHEKSHPYKCQSCGMTFVWNNDLISHIQSKHEMHQLYKCKICDKSFAESLLLMVHIETHVKPDENFFECSYEGCDKSFKREKNRTNHLRRHRIGEQYKCESCDKTFADKGTLRMHLTSHTGEMPFRCYICNKAFRGKNILDMHLKSCRGNDQNFEIVKVEETRIMKEEFSVPLL